MITILVVGPADSEPSAPAAGRPSVEILRAEGTEDALERLARNRRIDAVLLLEGAGAAELASTLAEEDPAAPPLFAPASLGAIPGVTHLAGEDVETLLDSIVRRLEPGT